MSFSLVQSKSAANLAGNPHPGSISFSSALTVGNVVVVSYWAKNGNGNSFTFYDNSGNPYGGSPAYNTEGGYANDINNTTCTHQILVYWITTASSSTPTLTTVEPLSYISIYEFTGWQGTIGSASGDTAQPDPEIFCSNPPTCSGLNMSITPNYTGGYSELIFSSVYGVSTNSGTLYPEFTKGSGYTEGQHMTGHSIVGYANAFMDEWQVVSSGSISAGWTDARSNTDDFASMATINGA